MTDKELKVKILAEIERLKKTNEVSDNEQYAQYELDAMGGYDSALDDILSFIDSLQEEPVSEDLKYTAEAHSLLVPSELYHLLQDEQQKLWKKEIEDAFKAGAQWQKQQLENETE